MSHYYKHSVSDYPPRIVCYVCGLEGPADYPVYMAPLSPGSGHNKAHPFFPFLKELEPPLGCRPPDRDTAVFSCRQCYSALMKQWDDNEQGGVPTEKRVYWTKRCAGLPILDPEQQLAVNRDTPSPAFSLGLAAGTGARDPIYDGIGPRTSAGGSSVNLNKSMDNAMPAAVSKLSQGSRYPTTLPPLIPPIKEEVPLRHQASDTALGLPKSSPNILDISEVK